MSLQPPSPNPPHESEKLRNGQQPKFASSTDDPEMQNLLIVARVLVYDDTGDKELDAWKSIAKLLNERMDPTSYQEFCVYTGQSAKDWYERLEAEENFNLIWWKFMRSCNDGMKSSRLRIDPEKFYSLMATIY